MPESIWIAENVRHDFSRKNPVGETKNAGKGIKNLHDHPDHDDHRNKMGHIQHRLYGFCKPLSRERVEQQRQDDRKGKAGKERIERYGEGIPKNPFKVVIFEKF